MWDDGAFEEARISGVGWRDWVRYLRLDVRGKESGARKVSVTKSRRQGVQHGK